MSNLRGIAAVSSGLAKFFQAEFQRDGENESVLDAFPSANNENTFLFLYKTEVDPHYRNNVPGYEYVPTKAPLPVQLHYVLIFNHQSQTKAQIRLAQALKAIQRTPILPKQYAEQPVEGQNARVVDQEEPIRITHDNLSLEDLTKLWASFQLRYRLTMPFTASVLMLDVEPKPTDPKPILERPIPGKTLVVQPNLGTRILSAYGQLDDAPTSAAKRTTVPIGSYLVLEISGDIHSVKALELTFAEKLKDGTAEPESILLTDEIEQFGNRLRVQLPADKPWIAGVYQVKAILKDPFESHANSNKDPKSNSMLVKVAPSMQEASNGKFGEIQLIQGDRPRWILKTTFQTKPNVKVSRYSNPGQIPAIFTEPAITALFTQVELEEGNTSPKSFEIPIHELRGNAAEFWTHAVEEDEIKVEPGEKYVLRIKVGGLVSNHYSQDDAPITFDQRAVFNIQEEIENGT